MQRGEPKFSQRLILFLEAASSLSGDSVVSVDIICEYKDYISDAITCDYARLETNYSLAFFIRKLLYAMMQ